MSENSHGRIEVRLVNSHPGASPGMREVAHFKNVRREDAIRCLAAAQIALFGRTSMFRYELRHNGRWERFGPNGEKRVRAEVNRLANLWHPLDDLRRTPQEQGANT